MGYLYFVQALVNGIALGLSLKYDFYWPAFLNITNIALYVVGLVFVTKHFQNPNVPTDLASTAASIMGNGIGVAPGRIDSLEKDVKMLKQEIQEFRAYVFGPR